jgi:hypothetical protein
MKAHFIDTAITYNGEQLHSHFAYHQYGILGDSIISFRGPCDVQLQFMVDIEDKRAKSRIYSQDMLHFIIEHHDTDLEKAVLRQWLFAYIVKELISHKVAKNIVVCNGSDLFDQDAKLSVSVATVTPISSLIHFGINILTENTPVKTKGLADYNIEPVSFAHEVMNKYVDECAAIQRSRNKVTWVR